MLRTTLQRVFLTGLLIVLSSAIAFAYNITGTVVDETDETMPAATIRLVTYTDSTFVAGATTDTNGKFTLSGIKNGRYKLVSSFVGYGSVTTEVNVRNKNVALGNITLSSSSIMLKEATVKGIRTPIKVMQDTVEFAAESYKTQPNAVVEDLLKRLPGVEVDSEGKITANGKSVSKILVDGKEFFSDDPTVASRNLPVDIVDKLQVVDRKSDLARLTGVDDGEEETVINLTVKKDMNNGWYGKAEAGYGTDDKYSGNFTVNRMWNGNQLTILGNANNLNRLGFSDGTSGRFMRFGGSNGITTSQALGVNFNVGNGDIFRVGGDVTYSHSDRDTRQRQDRQYLFADSTSYLNSSRTARDKGHNVSARLQIQWKPDSFNTLDFRPTLSLNYNRSFSLDSSLTRAGDPLMSPVTESFNDASNRGTSVTFGGRLIYNHNFRQRRGRSFSVNLDYRLSNTRERSRTYSWNDFYLLDSIDVYDQYANNHSWSNSVSARLTWTEPLGNVKNGNFLTLAYRINYRWNNADKLTYDYPVIFPDDNPFLPPIIGEDGTLMEDLSNRFRNDFMNQDIRAGFKHVDKKSTLDVGLSLTPSMMKSKDLINSEKNIEARWQWNVAPYLRYRYRMGKNRSFNVDYRSMASQPSISQLQPVADMSDPLRIVIGNPDLDPTFTHNIGLRFQNFNPDRQQSLMVMMHGSLTQNSIVSRTSFNSETGGQTTTYANVNGVWNVRGMTMFSTPLPNREFTVNNHLGLNYSRTVGFNNDLRNVSGTFRLMESLGFAWKPDNAMLELRPFYSFENTANSVQSNANRKVHSYGGSFYGTYYTPFGLVLNTDLNYSATSGYSQGYDTKQWMWNASISYQFLKEKQATISVKAYDLLQQRTNIRRSVTANYIDDTMYNSLTRYFMVTFSYKFNTFKKGSEPKTNEFDGPRGPGRGPMGPPPGMGGGHRPM